jgi:hypothetical protein
MKACIVSSKTVEKYKRWDVAFYLGKEAEKRDDYGRAFVILKNARELVKRRREELAQEQERLKKMEEAGELREIQILS